mmetsp:Transcript_15566/g.28260  ORF Transcript_15566/g.28260 Transcript_15566/m.28260 type:complete len:353 (+) Transcript_15566:1260-2318(+)
MTLSTGFEGIWIGGVNCKSCSALLYTFNCSSSDSCVETKDYYTEDFRKSELTGYIASDIFRLGSIQVKVNFTIGDNYPLKSWEELESDGVLGLGINSNFLKALTDELKPFTIAASSDTPVIMFGSHATYKGSKSSLKSSDHWEIELDRLGYGNFYNTDTPDNVRFESEIEQIYLPSKSFSDFKDKYITANCFKADDHFNSAEYNGNDLYYCYCNGGGPGELPKFNFILKDHRYGLSSGDYMESAFVDENSITYCGLGIAKSGSSDVILGFSFLNNFEATFDAVDKEVYIKGGQNMSFWVIFDLNLALTGGILFTVLLITIIVFGIKRHRRLKAESESSTVEFSHVPHTINPA